MYDLRRVRINFEYFEMPSLFKCILYYDVFRYLSTENKPMTWIPSNINVIVTFVCLTSYLSRRSEIN